MISFPKPISSALSQQAYQRRITGQGPTHLQLRRSLITCPKCDKTMQHGNLLKHLKQVHKELPGIETFLPNNNPETMSATSRLLYITTILDINLPSPCPIPECTALIKSQSGMRSHFNHRHPYNHLVILEEGYLPRCPKCLLHSQNILNHMHTK